MCFERLKRGLKSATPFLMLLFLVRMPADRILCSLGQGNTTYNAYSDERPTSDAMELAGKVNAGLGSICRPNCPTMALFRNSSVPNIMLVATSDGQARIIYKPDFFTSVYEMYGDGGILAILAHEVGHAIDANGMAKWIKSTWSPELRADAWAGCALARVKLTARELRAAYSALEKYPSPSHPAWTARLPVVQAGYMECAEK